MSTHLINSTDFPQFSGYLGSYNQSVYFGDASFDASFDSSSALNSITAVTDQIIQLPVFENMDINPITEFVDVPSDVLVYETCKNPGLHSLDLYMAVMNATRDLNCDPKTNHDPTRILKKIKKNVADYVINTDNNVDYAFITTFDDFPLDVVKLLIDSYKYIPDGLSYSSNFFDPARLSEQHFYDYYGMMYPHCVLNLLVKAAVALRSEIKVEEYDADDEPDV